MCAWNGCTKPGIELEAHHLHSYNDGGETAIDNLVLLRRKHHRCNNDKRDGSGGKGHFTKDPATGKVQHHPARGGPARQATTYQYARVPGSGATTRPCSQTPRDLRLLDDESHVQRGQLVRAGARG